jgi:hypothetical protein
MLWYVPEVIKLWGAPNPVGAVGPLGERVVSKTDLFIFNEILAQDKIYILVGTLLG